jgi:uncharacterized protein DUF6152
VSGAVGRVLVFALVIGLCAAGVSAHHAISAVYDSRQPITIDGLVREFHLINPHPYLVIDVTSDTGVREQWRGELDNRHELVEIGVTAGTFKPGDRVVVKGSAGRTEPRSLYVLRLDRAADGFWYEQVGQSPRIRRPK